MGREWDGSVGLDAGVGVFLRECVCAWKQRLATRVRANGVECSGMGCSQFKG
jgi:hypothetical protein